MEIPTKYTVHRMCALFPSSANIKSAFNSIPPHCLRDHGIRSVESTVMLLQSSLTCMLFLALSWNRAASLMPLETQEDYLNHLYLQVKDRPLRNGELNLLPDETEPGFANTVRCVPETEGGTKLYVSSTHSSCTMHLVHYKAMILYS